MRTFTARQAAERYRVHRTTVLYWHSHGWIDPNTGKHRHLPAAINPTTGQPLTDPLTGAKLFHEADLIEAEQQTRAKRQRSHRASRRLLAA